MAYNPYATATPSQTTAQYLADPFTYDVIPSDVIRLVTLNPETNRVIIEKQNGSAPDMYNCADMPALILEFYAAAETAIDNGDPTAVDVFFQTNIDSGRLTTV